ncbi:MAG: isochorismatase family protein [Candidatus Heimdallarchaeota archaeon]|nr:MAG: isochorismatase family protein [Candidatus Heimdallarchaeota archaeon]
MKTLVIVDMQNDFFDEAITLIDNPMYNCNHNVEYIIPVIQGLVAHAIKLHWPIIFVEYTGFGKTMEEIYELTESYRKQQTIPKNEPNGAPAILNTVQNKNWPLNIIVCGLYGNVCVSETVAGLLYLTNEITISIITDAVWPDYCSRTKNGEEILIISDKILRESSCAVK